jgi:thioredoxin 1
VEHTVLELSDDIFDEVVNEAAGTILVEFWADWCKQCARLNPVMEELAVEMKGTARIARVNVDTNEEVPYRFGIRSVPTIIVFREGRLVDQLVGAAPKDEIRKLMNGKTGRQG